MRPRTALAVVVGTALLTAGGARATSGRRPTTCPLPRGSERVHIDPAGFTTRIDNPWWPMMPGSRWTYRETDPEGPTAQRRRHGHTEDEAHRGRGDGARRQ